MLAVGAPGDDKVALAEKVRQLAVAKGRGFVKGGVTLTEPNDVRAFLEDEAATFLGGRRRALEMLGVRMLGSA